MLGDSDLEVSVIGFGAWGIGGAPFWSNEGDENSARAIMKSYDLGVNFFDTSPTYGNAESLVGELKREYQERVIVATKAGLRPDGVRDFSVSFLNKEALEYDKMLLIMI